MTATSQHTARVELTVGQVAESFGVTVRTLHHYDAEGLVVPSARTHAGYRLYTDADLARLATVVTYRRLGLPLTEVRALLDGEGSRGGAPAPAARRGRVPAGRARAARHGHRPSTGGRDGRSDPPPPRSSRSSSATASARSTRPRRRSAGARATPGSSPPRRTKRYTKADWERSRPRGMPSNARPRRRAAVGCARHVARGDGCRRGAPRAHRAVVLRPRPRLPPGAGRHVPRRPAVHEDLRGPGSRASRSTCTTRSTPTPTGTSRPERRQPLDRRQHAQGEGAELCVLPPVDACSGLARYYDQGSIAAVHARDPWCDSTRRTPGGPAVRRIP